MDITATVTPTAHFDRQYQLHLKHLQLKGLQPKTIDAYARAIRRIGAYFAHDIDALSEHQCCRRRQIDPGRRKSLTHLDGRQTDAHSSV